MIRQKLFMFTIGFLFTFLGVAEIRAEVIPVFPEFDTIPDGTYQAIRVVCVAPTPRGEGQSVDYDVTAAARIDGTLNDTFTDDLLAIRTSGDGCFVTTRYHVEYTAPHPGEAASGVFLATQGRVNTSNRSACNAGFDLEPRGRITPSDVAFTARSGAPANPFRAAFLSDPTTGFLAIQSNFKAVGRPQDACFIHFQKTR